MHDNDKEEKNYIQLGFAQSADCWLAKSTPTCAGRTCLCPMIRGSYLQGSPRPDRAVLFPRCSTDQPTTTVQDSIVGCYIWPAVGSRVNDRGVPRHPPWGVSWNPVDSARFVLRGVDIGLPFKINIILFTRKMTFEKYFYKKQYYYVCMSQQ